MWADIRGGMSATNHRKVSASILPFIRCQPKKIQTLITKGVLPRPFLDGAAPHGMDCLVLHFEINVVPLG